MAVDKHELRQNLEILTALDACFSAKTTDQYENAYRSFDALLKSDHSSFYQLFEFTEIKDMAEQVYALEGVRKG